MAITIRRQSTELNIEIDKGSTFRHTFTWKAGTTGSETPVNMTGATAKMSVRTKNVRSQVLYDLTTENNGITLGDTDGTIELYIPSADSSAFKWSEGYYDLEIYLSGGDTRRLLRGKITTFSENTI